MNLAHEERGAIVGYVGAFHHRAQKIGHVFTLNVHPQERRRGLGRALMEACHDRLRAIGIRRVVLEVNVENDAALALYERLGYERAERLKGYYENYRDNDAWRLARAL